MQLRPRENRKEGLALWAEEIACMETGKAGRQAGKEGSFIDN